MAMDYDTTAPYLIARLFKQIYVVSANGRISKSELYADYTVAHLEEHEADYAHILATEGEEEANRFTYQGPVNPRDFFRYLPAAMAQAFPKAIVGRERIGTKFGTWNYRGIERLFGEQSQAMLDKLKADKFRDDTKAAARAIVGMSDAAQDAGRSLSESNVEDWLLRNVSGWR